MRHSRSAVTLAPAAEPALAHEHFAQRLALETDADDVAAAIREDAVDFTLVDVRSPEAFAAGHLPGAANLPHHRIDAEAAAALPDGLVVVYCWGPGCNGATKGAARLAGFGRRVKEMLGGFEYYVREGHPVVGHAADAGVYQRDEGGVVALPSAFSCGC
jgi:rhodanese-related sulfurtransferase